MVYKEFDSTKYDAWPTVSVLRTIGYVKLNQNIN